MQTVSYTSKWELYTHYCARDEKIERRNWEKK